MKVVIVTGSQGFIGSYICQEFLANNFRVYGIDNYSKYGRIRRPQDHNSCFHLIEHDLTKSFPDLTQIRPDYMVCCAARIGGIEYFHKYAFDLLRDNELILANTFNFLLNCQYIKRVVMLSSSMVYESADSMQYEESEVDHIPPPKSSYGFQKLAVEYWCKAFYEQYGLEYTIIRPFNAVGIGEDKALSNNEHLTLSHVIPDFVGRALRRENPFKIYGNGQQSRCFTNCYDIARGVYCATLSNLTTNYALNISSTERVTMQYLAEKIWTKINGPNLPAFEYLPPFKYDVQDRFPDTKLAKNLLGFVATIPLDESIDEVIDYMKNLN